jgi:hypothetical protein
MLQRQRSNPNRRKQFPGGAVHWNHLFVGLAAGLPASWLVPNADLYKLCFGPEVTQFLLELFAILFTTACDYNVGACRCKSHRRGAADARKGSGDQNNLFRHNNSLSSSGT